MISNSSPRYMPGRIKTLYPHKNFYTDVHGSIVHSSRKAGNSSSVH